MCYGCVVVEAITPRERRKKSVYEMMSAKNTAKRSALKTSQKMRIFGVEELWVCLHLVCNSTLGILWCVLVIFATYFDICVLYLVSTIWRSPNVLL